MNCGPLCLKYVIERDGGKISKTKAARLCKTKKIGTYYTDMRAAFQSLGYYAELKENMTWDELREYVNGGIWVIAAWTTIFNPDNMKATPPDGHYSVVVAVGDNIIKLYDPDFDDEIRLPRQTFETLWTDFEYVKKIRHDFIRSGLITRKLP